MNPLLSKDRPAPNVVPALHALRRGLATVYGPRLSEVVLFGSCARGTADADSDVDILVVLKDEANLPRRDAYLLCPGADFHLSAYSGVTTGYFLRGGCCTLVVWVRPPCPRKSRVPANSPSLCPPMFSVRKIGT